MIRTSISALVAVLWAASAFAGCRAEMELVLSCDISARKHLEVCIGEGKASYAFGPKGAPELALTQPLGQVQGTAWPGAGSSIWEDIRFTNSGISYTAFIGINRNTPDALPFGGVMVARGDDVLASLQCRQGTVKASVFSISDGFRDAGYCWDRDAQLYSRRCS